jgi:O-antigen/teichoic acid export membrane protein
MQGPMSTQSVAVERPPIAAQERRPALAGAWIVSGAMLVSGTLIYAFNVLAARVLGGDGYGQIAVLWAAMFLVVIVMFRPLEQTASRAIAERLARGEEAGSVIRSVSIVGSTFLLLLLAAVTPVWDVLADRLFQGNNVLLVLLLVGVACYGIAYVTRGAITGVRWFGGYGLALIADGLARLAIAAPLVIVASRNVAAAAVTIAGLAGALVPLWVGRRRLRTLLTGRGGAPFPMRATLAFAGPASFIAAADQLLVNCSPLLVTLEGGAARTAGLVFAATMLVRVPVFVFQGLASSILPNLTRLHVVEDPARFRRAVLQTAGFLLVAGGLIVAFAGAVGPEAMELLFGSSFATGRLELVLLGAGVACYLAATTFSQALLALDRGRLAASAWVGSAALFIGLYFTLAGDELARVSMAFVVATLADLVLLAAFLLRGKGSA